MRKSRQRDDKGNALEITLPPKRRRRRYQCCQCLADILEYPFLIVDGSALWCSDCQRKEEEKTREED